MSTLDETMMGRALVLARRGEGLVEPNPTVGCVIVKSGKVIGEGYHRRFGGPHAEIEALRNCKSNPRGATAYVTLEPCCHFGKTPPCTDALIAAGIRTVVIPLVDPDPKVRGGGVRALRKAGVRVHSGVLAEEAAELIAPFAVGLRRRRPYVIAKWAQSLDGSLVTRPGDSRWISGPESQRVVHRLRARVDAVMVGVGTVLADDPMLNARGVPVKRLAMRVVLDSRLRTPPQSKLVATASALPTVLFTSTEAMDSRRAAVLRCHGVTLLGCPQDAGRLRLGTVLRRLHGLGVTNLLVEGGPTLLSSFFREGWVDEARLFVARRWIGTTQGGLSSHGDIPARRVEVRNCGDDFLYTVRFGAPRR